MLPFVKYHGLGNDFVIIDGGDDVVTVEEVVAICDRHRGVGADGVLVVDDRGGDDAAVFRMVIFNRDGSRAEMCGNGVRCVAAYARRHAGAGRELIIESDAARHRCRVESGDGATDMVTVEMGPVEATCVDDPLEIKGYSFDYVFVETGNPHAVIFDDPDRCPVQTVGEVANASHPSFPDGVNVEFAIDDDDDGYRTVVYERGVGFTQACGTGACAVAEAAWTTGRMARSRDIRVELPGGALTIACDENCRWMTGPAEEVFSGRWVKT